MFRRCPQRISTIQYSTLLLHLCFVLENVDMTANKRISNITEYLSNPNDDVFIISCASTNHTIPVTGLYANQIYAHFGFCLIVFIPSFILNIFAIVAILRKKSLRTLPNILIINVFLGNAFVGFFICIWCVNFVLAVQRKQNCELYLITVSAGYTCSLLGLFEICLVSIERFIAIYYPWFYGAKKEKIETFFLWAILIIWAFSVSFGGTSSLSPNFNLIKLTLSFMTPIMISCCGAIHVKIYYTTSESMERLKRVTVNVCPEHEKVSSSEVVKERFKFQDRRLFIVTGGLVLQLVICYLPSSIIVMYRAFTKHENTIVASVLFNWGVTMAAFKCFTNLVTFVYQLKSLRDSLKEIFLARKINSS